MIDKLKGLLAVINDPNRPAREMLRVEYELIKMLPDIIERLVFLEAFYAETTRTYQAKVPPK